MPDRRIHFRDFSKGLYLSAAPDEIPRGAVVRARGIHPLARGKFRVRDGSTQLHAVNDVHSLAYYNSKWYYGASTAFYTKDDTGSLATEDAELRTSLSGDRLSFTRMPPVAGISDYLFVAGGDDLFKVSDTVYLSGTELVENGTMELDSNWYAFSFPATNERSSTYAHGGTYSRKFTANSAGDGIRSEAISITEGWYQLSAWVYSDDHETVAVYLYSGDTDAYRNLTYAVTQDAWTNIVLTVYLPTDAQYYIAFYSGLLDAGDWYIDDVSLQRAYYATNWGIEPPPAGFTNADSGNSGALNGVYKYALTYKNSVTGTRSDPTYADLASSYFSLLLHMDGADASTTFTDSGNETHTVTAQGDAQLDTAQKKSGTASGLFDGTGDYLSIPHHASLNAESELFTISFWMRPAVNMGSGTEQTNLYTHGSVAAYASNMRVMFGYGYISFVAIIDGLNKVSCNYYIGSLSADTWYHIAVMRGWQGVSRRFALCVNGSAVATDEYTGSLNITGSTYIGQSPDLGSGFNGWIDELAFLKGFAWWTNDFSANLPEAAFSATELNISNGTVDIESIPDSPDPQVDLVEVWRTAAGGSDYYLVTTLADGTTSYEDTTADADLSTTDLPFDNLKPYSWFDDCFGPYNASMFWITRSQAGERGRVYYSPVGRAEAVDGFINVCNDDSPLQRGIEWGGNLLVWGTKGVYQVYGTNPYYSRRVSGVPGTDKPHTVTLTPAGVLYEAEDGVRLFDGATAALVTKGTVEDLFRGDSAGELSAFDGVVAAYARNEYLISDESQLLALDITEMRWRDIGLAVKSLHYAETADQIGAGTPSDGIYALEAEGTTEDNDNFISISLEPAHERIGTDQGGIVKHLHLDADTKSQTLGVWILLDDDETYLGTLNTSERSTQTYHVNKTAKTVSFRLTGHVDAKSVIYDAYVDVHMREEETGEPGKVRVE